MPQATTASPFTVYDLNVGTIVDIEDIITQLDPSDVPLLGMNGADGSFAIPRGTTFEKRKDWLDDVLLAPRCTVGTAANGTHDATNGDAIIAGDATFYLASKDANRFPVGSVLLLEAEYVYVSAIDSTGQQLTVSRGYGGSTAAAHVAGKDIVGIGMALNEGSAPGVARAVDRANRFNITQIFGPHLVSVSGTEMVVRKYGLSGTTEFAYQAGQRAKELYISLEQAVMYSILQDTPTQATKGRTMGGMIGYITTNVDSSTTAFSESALLAQHQAAWQAGGNPRNLLMAPKQKRAMSAFYQDPGANAAILRRMASDPERGEVVDRYVSDFGVLEAKMSRWCRTADLFGFDRDQLSLDCLRPVQFELLEKTGDSVQGQIVGEYTLVFRRQKHAFRFSALQ